MLRFKLPSDPECEFIDPDLPPSMGDPLHTRPADYFADREAAWKDLHSTLEEVIHVAHETLVAVVRPRQFARKRVPFNQRIYFNQFLSCGAGIEPPPPGPNPASSLDDPRSAPAAT